MKHQHKHNQRRLGLLWVAWGKCNSKSRYSSSNFSSDSVEGIWPWVTGGARHPKVNIQKTFWNRQRRRVGTIPKKAPKKVPYRFWSVTIWKFDETPNFFRGKRCSTRKPRSRDTSWTTCWLSNDLERQRCDLCCLRSTESFVVFHFFPNSWKLWGLSQTRPWGTLGQSSREVPRFQARVPSKGSGRFQCSKYGFQVKVPEGSKSQGKERFWKVPRLKVRVPSKGCRRFQGFKQRRFRVRLLSKVSIVPKKSKSKGF